MSDGFEAIVAASTLQDFVDTFETVVDEATFEFREDCIWASPVDPANVAMITQRLRAEACESYHSAGERVGLNLSRFDDYLSEADSDDLVHLTLNLETRRVGIEYGDVDVQMAAIDPDSIRDGNQLPEDAIDSMTTDVWMDGAAFEHAVDVAGLASDHIGIDADPDREAPIHIVAEGDTDDVAVKMSSSLHEGSEVNAEAFSLFSEDYLDDLTGAIPKTADLRIRHGEEWPMLLEYEYPDAAVDVEIGLAPRIQSE